MSKMFSFFRKSKREDRRNKEPKESTPPRGAGTGSRDANKNNHQKPESVVAVPLPNYSSEVGPVKNATNAPSQADAANEKIDANSRSANPDAPATMCDDNATTLNANTSHANMLKKPEPMVERRGSGVKPCGHGTTAIAPWVAVLGHRNDNACTPPSSPVLEAKKALKVVQNGLAGNASKEEKDEKDTVTASMKLHVNLPITSSEKTSQGNGVENQVEMYVILHNYII